MKFKVLVAAAAMGAAALLPTAALADTGGFYWSPDGSGIQSASLENPQSGRCYTLRGSEPPFYAINVTNSTMHYYGSAGCTGQAGSLTPNMSGNVTRYVKFD
ncbi:hypothetical protein [Streptomyces sp. AK02-04a]|uniref:hypothetical protein n=1 Tax=Streptomyces sp. AK02-04a TaxID=3028649 RepID=UPI0029B0B9C2|nr:hypothetical protein [Streptomyces sp. AK02-04a]MDX3763395.1 hypothetical protein [Streptomyces sp. AK02-04a]